MCRLSGKMSERQMNGSKKNEKPDDKSSASIDNGSSNNNGSSRVEVLKRRRRTKYDREGSEAMLLVRESYLEERESSSSSGTFVLKKTKKKSKLSKRHEKDSPSGGMEALIPSLIGVIALVVIVMGKMGFRGRASVAGIDLGTTNSVICVQQQSKGVGQIECIPDPYNNSPIIPSVISFLDNTSTTTTSSTTKKKMEGTTFPVNPSHVIVGSEAKSRIDSHPHHTLYHAKRVIAQSFSSNTVKEMMEEVEFDIVANETDDAQNVLFRVPFHGASVLVTEENDRFVSLSPQQVGSYVVNHLIQLTQDFLGHENVKSAVIAVPAKFDRTQRDITVEAFKKAGVTVTRILEEPVAAALAYGLQKKENVDYIMVYDFGGGTLDVSILHVAEGGYVEVMGSDGDEHLGGADFDAAVAHLLLNKYDTDDHHMIQSVTNAIQNLALPHKKNHNDNDSDDTFDVEEQLATSCPKLKNIPLCTLSSFHTIGEKIKIQLSSFPNGGATVKESCYGLSDTSSTSHDTATFEDFCTQLEIITMEVSSSEYDSVCQSLYHRSMIPIRTLLNDLNIEPDEVDEVVMVGGTTRMPKIRTMVQEELGVSSLNTEIDPDITVAYGAASVID